MVRSVSFRSYFAEGGTAVDIARDEGRTGQVARTVVGTYIDIHIAADNGRLTVAAAEDGAYGAACEADEGRSCRACRVASAVQT